MTKKVVKKTENNKRNTKSVKSKRRNRTRGNRKKIKKKRRGEKRISFKS